MFHCCYIFCHSNPPCQSHTEFKKHHAENTLTNTVLTGFEIMDRTTDLKTAMSKNHRRKGNITLKLNTTFIDVQGQS